MFLMVVTHPPITRGLGEHQLASENALASALPMQTGRERIINCTFCLTTAASMRRAVESLRCHLMGASVPHALRGYDALDLEISTLWLDEHGIHRLYCR